MKRCKITSYAENSATIEEKLTEAELNIVVRVLKKLNIKGKEKGYCASFSIEDEDGEIILDY